MATGLPAVTGDVLTAATFNGLITFTVGTANTVDYTAVLADQYQVLQLMNKATAVAFKIPTDASVAFPVGTAITVLNIGVGTCTISAVTPGTTTISIFSFKAALIRIFPGSAKTGVPQSEIRTKDSPALSLSISIGVCSSSLCSFFILTASNFRLNSITIIIFQLT